MIGIPHHNDTIPRSAKIRATGGAYASWLNPAMRDRVTALGRLVPYAAAKRRYAVSTRINLIQNDDAEGEAGGTGGPATGLAVLIGGLFSSVDELTLDFYQTCLGFFDQYFEHLCADPVAHVAA